ncbi:MAG: zinc ribbon domain-containing protein [Clostridia bacterium]|nr:zinc ribbon domain-containing protein [Clostridia bacterium]
MSRLTDRISYLRGLAEGMKLNPEKDSHRLILGILEVLGEVGDSFEALAEDHGELAEYVEAIDEDLADLEANLYDDEDESLAKEQEDGEFEDMIEYECPHCGAKIEIDPDKVDFDEDALCPECGKELFPELPEEPAEAPKGETATEEKTGTEEKEEKQEKQEKQ